MKPDPIVEWGDRAVMAATIIGLILMLMGVIS